MIDRLGSINTLKTSSAEGDETEELSAADEGSDSSTSTNDNDDLVNGDYDGGNLGD